MRTHIGCGNASSLRFCFGSRSIWARVEQPVCGLKRTAGIADGFYFRVEPLFPSFGSDVAVATFRAASAGSADRISQRLGTHLHNVALGRADGCEARVHGRGESADFGLDEVGTTAAAFE